MTELTITDVRQPVPGQWHVVFQHENGEQWETAMPNRVVAGRMAEHGYTDPGEALLATLHEPHLWTLMHEAGHKDDPAVVAGWVTTTDPDSEPITVYTARSTSDAYGAHEARLAAVRDTVTLTDPQNLLPALQEAVTPAPDDLAAMRQQVDVVRWVNNYGGLPLPEPAPSSSGIPLQQEG